MKRISSIGIAVGVTALLGGSALAQPDYDDEFEAGVEVEEDLDDADPEVEVDVDVEPEPYDATRPAQTAPPPPPPERTTVVVDPVPAQQPQVEEYRLRSEIGIQVSVGGGATGFIDGDARDFTDPGGAWEARVAIGTRYPLAIEAAYIGGAQDVEALGLDEDAIMLSNGAEASARLNVLGGQFPVQPYVLAGAAWKRYDLTNTQFNTSSLNGEENVVEIPVGAGIGFKAGPVRIDARGTYRPAFYDDLVRVDAGPGDVDPGADLDSWRGTLSGGFEF